MMRPLLALSRAIDLLNEKIGYVCNLLVLAACGYRGRIFPFNINKLPIDGGSARWNGMSASC
jgi:hypothetical protein